MYAAGLGPRAALQRPGRWRPSSAMGPVPDPSTPRRPRVAVLSVSAGAGHVRAAQALVATAEDHHPGAELVHLDLMDLVGRAFRAAYASGYLRLVDRHPQLWGRFYRATDRPLGDKTLNRVMRQAERYAARSLKTWLRRLDPDHVICTHYMPAQILSRMRARGTWTRPVWVVVTDFDSHALWIHDRIDGYCCASDEVAWRMRARGVPAATIHVTGIPIMPVFGQRLDRATCAAEIGTEPGKPTLLMMSGGHGLSGLHDQVDALLQLPGDFQLVALAGRNAELLAALRGLAAQVPGRLVPMGFTTTIQRVMAACDLAVTKPGGLTTSECLAMGLPLVVVSPIPGQEERNADHLMEEGAALMAHDDATLGYKIDLLLREPDRLARMAAAARTLGRPDAAARVLERVLG